MGSLKKKISIYSIFRIILSIVTITLSLLFLVTDIFEGNKMVMPIILLCLGTSNLLMGVEKIKNNDKNQGKLSLLAGIVIIATVVIGLML